MTESKSRAGGAMPQARSAAQSAFQGHARMPEAEVTAAMAGFLTEFGAFQAEVKSALQQQDERLTMLNAKSQTYGRPALSAHAEPAYVRMALLERARVDASRAELIAMILHCTEPDLIVQISGDGPTLALQLLPEDPELVALFATRLAAAMPQDPEIWGKSPSTELLQDRLNHLSNTAAELPLLALIAATNAAQPEDGLA